MWFPKALALASVLACASGTATAITLYAFDDQQLAVALSQATSGDVVKVGPGSYGNLLIRGDAFNQVNVGGNIILGGAPNLLSTVTVESLEPSNPAVIHSLDVRSSNYWNFSNVDVRPTPAGSSFTAVRLAGNHNAFQL